MSAALPSLSAAESLPLWDEVIGQEDLGRLPADLDPAQVQVARAYKGQGGDLVCGYFVEEPGGRRAPTARLGDRGARGRAGA